MLQIGTGAFLRGFVGDILAESNASSGTDLGIVAIASTRSRRVGWLQAQEGLYTVQVEGMRDGRPQRHFRINAVTQQAFAAGEDWAEVLALAQRPEVMGVVSNTTEVGIRYEAEDLFGRAPATYPGKLTALLYARFQALAGDPDKGWVILPCELLENNGDQLRACVQQHVLAHGLPLSFRRWLDHACIFANTLVDRIVTGTPAAEVLSATEASLGYSDSLLTVTEPYALWAIEGDDRLRARLPFAAHPSVVISPDIEPYRERKLRILNGSHTFMVGLGYLCGLDTVRDCTEDPAMGRFLTRLMEEEIVPSLPANVPGGLVFARDVMARFQNPFLAHRLLDISLQYTSKMRMRNATTFGRYAETFGSAPLAMSLGFAAFLAFVRPEVHSDGKWLGQRGDTPYELRDDQASAWAKRWQSFSDANPSPWVRAILADTSLWGRDLSTLPGLVEQVGADLSLILTQGARAALQARLG